MKVLLTLIVISSCIICKSQVTFPEPGMIQGILYSGNIYQSPKDANRTEYYLSDTILCGITYSVICQKYDWWTGLPLNCQGYYRKHFRQDGSKIVAWGGGCGQPELVYYDFGLNIGDTIGLNFNTFNPSGEFVVDSVSTITLGNKQRKFLRLHGADQFSTNTILRWVEGIGDIDRGFFCVSDFEGGRSTFICHKENGSVILSGNQSSFDCDSFTQSGTTVYVPNLSKGNNYIVYPSFITDYFSIKNLSNIITTLDVHVYNSIGQKILYERKNTNEKINMPQIETGIYWVLIKDPDDNQKMLKVIKIN